MVVVGPSPLKHPFQSTLCIFYRKAVLPHQSFIQKDTLDLLLQETVFQVTCKTRRP